MQQILHFIGHLMGLDDTSGPIYLFWSGFAGSAVNVGVIWAIYRHHKCKNCCRIGKVPVEGTPYKTCHKHATIAHHSKIHHDHEEKHPLQHQLLNKKP